MVAEAVVNVTVNADPNAVAYYGFSDFEGLTTGTGTETRGYVRGIAAKSDEQAYSGLYSYKLDEDLDAIRLSLTEDVKSGNVVSIMLYDNMTSHNYMGVGIRVADAIGLGIMASASKEYYSYANGSKWIATTVERTAGWHELKLDYTDGQTCVLYIDDAQVGVIDNFTACDLLVIGDNWGSGGSISNMYFDDLKIYKKSSEEEPKVSITVSGGDADVTLLDKGGRFEIKAKVENDPENAVTLAYTSANDEVATVTKDGWITGVTAGTTEITVEGKDSSGAVVAEAVVNVTVNADPNAVAYYGFSDFEGLTTGTGTETRGYVRGIAAKSDEQAYSGLYSYKLDEDLDAIRLSLTEDVKSGNVVSIMLYDNMTSHNYMGVGIRVADAIGLGIMASASKEYYSYANGSKWIATTVERTAGWHELKLDYTDGQTCVLYIDDAQVGVIDNFTACDLLVIGDNWGSGGSISNMYFDDLKIYKPVAADTANEE